MSSNGGTPTVGDLIARLRATPLPATKSLGLSDWSEEECRALAKPIVKFVRQAVSEATAPLLDRIAALESKRGLAPLAARLAHLEQRQLSYEGTWNETKAYNAGSFVTFQGGLWFAEDTSVGVRPGAGSSSWKLAVKRGRADR